MTMTTVGLVLVFLGLSMTIYGVLELRAPGRAAEGDVRLELMTIIWLSIDLRRRRADHLCLAARARAAARPLTSGLSAPASASA